MPVPRGGQPHDEQRVLIVTGPTASGKGTLARALAERLGGEIVSIDSMKVYRGLDVVTAKPTASHRRAFRYHLIDIRDPHEEFSVGEYLQELTDALAEIRARRRWAILCGGTALYIKAFLEGFQEAPTADWELRARLLTEARERGSETLHDRLRELDPDAAERVHRSDVRRIVRALEIREKTGEPAGVGRDWKPIPEPSRYPVFAIARDRAELYARIDRRVERMAEAGLFEEAERLRTRVPPLGRSAAQCIGYKEICEGLAAGRSRPEMISAVQQATRRFAKRQLTWYRKFPLRWLAVSAWPDAANQADEICSGLGVN